MLDIFLFFCTFKYQMYVVSIQIQIASYRILVSISQITVQSILRVVVCTTDGAQYLSVWKSSTIKSPTLATYYNKNKRETSLYICLSPRVPEQLHILDDFLPMIYNLLVYIVFPHFGMQPNWGFFLRQLNRATLNYY